MRKISQYFRGFIYSLALITLCFSVFSLLNNNEIEGNVSSEVGTEVYYDNYGWIELEYLRDKNTITRDSDSVTTILVNAKLLLTGINDTSIPQEFNYSYTSRAGFEVSGSVKANIKSFEAEIGFTLNLEVETTIGATMTVPAGSTIDLYKYDNRIRRTTVKNVVTEELWKWLSWRYHKDMGTYYEYLYEFGGVTLRTVER